MEWVKLIVGVLLGLGFFGTMIKWIFSPRFRMELKKKNFKEDKIELDNYLEACKKFNQNKNSLQPIQFQYATNHFLGTNRYHYSFFNKRINNLWNFNKIFSDLNHGYFFLKQSIENNQAYLEYTFKEKTIKNIKSTAIIILICAALVYLGLVIFEVFFLEELTSSKRIDKDAYSFYKILSCIVYVVLIIGASYFGGKASTALYLKDIFDIRNKSDQN
ncbi:hypothetical protein [Acinetobacter sp. NBRC 100985]|uniref:hypothetical protein n=1 Tax=Acinetobacter sp. NBRC 100985 TaxID=1071390 RepID=UPI000235D841|nr:hypothetical protein [Acinetobacter sp. NBRC 100985]GAB01498.1 hypothetical protein ACT4_021_01140 [Acinetobacter sp. NBRC 100985]